MLAIRRRLGGTFAGLLRSGAHEFAPWPCMLSRLLSGNPAARHDSRLRRLLPKFDAHPQRMHLREMGIESHISRTRGKFNGANSTHYILCTDEVRGMRCRLSSDADGETDTLASPEHFAFYQPLLVLNPTPNVLASLSSGRSHRDGELPFCAKTRHSVATTFGRNSLLAIKCLFTVPWSFENHIDVELAERCRCMPKLRWQLR
ncbi:MAG: hypothetical protein WCA78_00160 [Rhizomicrobium sp.]